MPKISDLGRVVTGTTPSESTDWGIEVPFLTPSEMGWRESRPKVKRWITPEAANRLQKRIVPAGSTAVVCIGATIGKVARILHPTLTNQQINTIVPGPNVDARFVYYKLSTMVDHLQAIAGGSATPILSKSGFSEVELDLPPLNEQRGIAEVLGALDDLIDTNEELHDLLLESAFAIFQDKTKDAPLVALETLGVRASRGVAPVYANGPGDVQVINQKCIRANRVDVRLARRMEPRKVRSDKLARPGDTLVNSQGVGTLGRVARWLGSEPVNVDSLVTVVQANDQSLAGFVAYAVMSRTKTIESFAQGSTGQTSLPLDRLLRMEVPNLTSGDVIELSRILDEFDRARAELLAEASQLRSARDELLPLLISGEMRVGQEGVAA